MRAEMKSFPLLLTIRRDSVSAGDDVDAPHELSLTLASEDTLIRVCELLLQAEFPARIAGGRATWILEAERPLAVIAQQWLEPRFLVDKTTPALTLVRSDVKPSMHLKYWCQADPGLVFDCLLKGKDLPDKFGRT
jgi:hypothetical protein